MRCHQARRDQGPRNRPARRPAEQRATLSRMILALEGWPMAEDRLVAVSYPVDEDFVRVNSDVLADEATIVYTYELGDAQRAQALRRAQGLVALGPPPEVPPAPLPGAPPAPPGPPPPAPA